MELVRSRKENGLCACGAPRLEEVTTCDICWFKRHARDATGRTSDWVGLKVLFDHQGGLCAYSGRPLTFGPNTTLDHKTPRSRSGGNELSNFQWVTRRVNTMKTDFTHDEFIRACHAIARRFPVPLAKTA